MGRNGHENLAVSELLESISEEESLPTRMQEQGLIAIELINNDRFSGKSEPVYRWSEGLTIEDLQSRLNTLVESKEISRTAERQLISHFLSNASQSFGLFSLGEIDPVTGDRVTIAVLPSPNMAGKSTFLKAIGLILHSALMARTVPAQSAKLTIPDQIYHNFNVADDISQQRSTLKAQLENIRDFLSTATINSLGLFDELFNGTSADYQLALAWAFLEECERNKLRVIISTHNRELEFFGSSDGYAQIAGSHHRPKNPLNDFCSGTAKTISIDKYHKVTAGSQRDSEALTIAKQVLSPDYDGLITRSEKILEHIRSPKD